MMSPVTNITRGSTDCPVANCSGSGQTRDADPPLRPLLSDQVFKNFSSAIEERNRRGHRLETTLIGISAAEIAGAEFLRQSGEARITVRFSSQQVDVKKDSEGRIVEGDPGEVATIVDLWTFARSVKSRDPNWTLVATESPQ